MNDVPQSTGSKSTVTLIGHGLYIVATPPFPPSISRNTLLRPSEGFCSRIFVLRFLCGACRVHSVRPDLELGCRYDLHVVSIVQEQSPNELPSLVETI